MDDKKVFKKVAINYLLNFAQFGMLGFFLFINVRGLLGVLIAISQALQESITEMIIIMILLVAPTLVMIGFFTVAVLGMIYLYNYSPNEIAIVDEKIYLKYWFSNKEINISDIKYVEKKRNTKQYFTFRHNFVLKTGKTFVLNDLDYERFDLFLKALGELIGEDKIQK